MGLVRVRVRRVMCEEMVGGEAYSFGGGLDGAPRGRPQSVWHQIRGVARGSTEGTPLVPSGRGPGGVLHAGMA